MLICDSESDGFKYEATKIWVICAYDLIYSRFTFSYDSSVFDKANSEAWLEAELEGSGVDYGLFSSHEEHLKYMEDKEVCFHNYFQHDKPLIKRFYPWFQPKDEHDSYILSQTFNPDRGKHGLADWGERFGIPKPKHEEWDKFSPEMLHRVIEDVKINVEVWKHLMKEKEAWEKLGQSWDEAIRIEYGIADLQGRQEMAGTLLDVPKAYDLADEIYLEIQKVDEQLLQQMPMRVIRYPEVAYEREPFTIKGEVKKAVTDWFEV